MQIHLLPPFNHNNMISEPRLHLCILRTRRRTGLQFIGRLFERTIQTAPGFPTKRTTYVFLLDTCTTTIIKKEKRRNTLTGLILRILPSHIIKLGSIPQLLQSFLFLGVLLTLYIYATSNAMISPITHNTRYHTYPSLSIYPYIYR